MYFNDSSLVVSIGIKIHWARILLTSLKTLITELCGDLLTKNMVESLDNHLIRFSSRILLILCRNEWDIVLIVASNY